MDNFHLLEDGGSIVGDQHLSFPILDLKRVIGSEKGRNLPFCPCLWVLDSSSLHLIQLNPSKHHYQLKLMEKVEG